MDTRPTSIYLDLERNDVLFALDTPWRKHGERRSGHPVHGGMKRRIPRYARARERAGAGV